LQEIYRQAIEVLESSAEESLARPRSRLEEDIKKEGRISPPLFRM
jgi:hypothetical protein